MVLATQNPFKPTAGMNPPELIGRQDILEDFTDSLEMGVGAPYRLMRIAGPRGVGKTALLNALARTAREDYGFAVVSVTSEGSVCERIANEVARLLPSVSAQIEPEAFGFKLGSISLEHEPPRYLDDLMLEATKKRGLLVTVDEIQDIDLEELRSIANNVQLVIREEGNIAFAFAGLPSAVDDAVNHPGSTFLQRAALVELEPLDVAEVQDSYADIIQGAGLEMEEGSGLAMARASMGHPFMVQLIGFYSWQEAARRASDLLSLADAQKGIEKAVSRFEAAVIRPTLSRLSPAKVAYLRAMAACKGEAVQSKDVAEALGKRATEVSATRARLIDAGIIDSPSYGKARFALPYLREYLLQQDLGE